MKLVHKDDTDGLFCFLLVFSLRLQTGEWCTRVHVVCVVLDWFVNIIKIFLCHNNIRAHDILAFKTWRI